MSEQPRVTIVHERFTEYAGSEAVVEVLARHWPQAQLRAPIARRGVLPPDLEQRLRTTPLSRLVRGSTYAHLLPALPVAMRSLHLPPSDVVIASHHAFATQVAVGRRVPTVAYVHTPARWIWESAMRTGEGSGMGAAGLAAFSATFKPFDVLAARHVNTLVANSHFVADRIRRWWGREARVVAPPVDTGYYHPDPAVPREDFFLLAGRLVPYKRPDLAVRAAQRAGVRLVVAGEGRALDQVRRTAGPDTTFLGRVSDAELRDLYRRCRALVMPGVEDFGIVPVEAMACGAPVVATAVGGSVDTVVPGLSGALVTAPREAAAEVDAWAAALLAFDPTGYDPARVRAHAETFSRERFRAAMGAVVADALESTAIPGQRRDVVVLPETGLQQTGPSRTGLRRSSPASRSSAAG